MKPQQNSNTLFRSETYRYPFTPYPRGWYFLSEVKRQSRIRVVFAGEVFDLGEKSLVNKRVVGERGSELLLAIRGGKIFAMNAKERPIFSAEAIPLVEAVEEADCNWPAPDPIRLRFMARSHIQEVAENALDLAHFPRVHAYDSDPELLDFHVDGPSFSVTLKAARRILGMSDWPVMTITYFGLGIVVAHITSKPVNLSVLLTSTPIDEQHILIHHWIAVDRRFWPRDWFYRLVLPPIIRKDFARDIPIWESKCYTTTPKLVASEWGVARVRRWAQQFY